MTQGRFHKAVGGEGGRAGALLDAEQLDRQTGGDRDLAAEVLVLFAQQAREAHNSLDGVAAEALPAAMHRLKGSARAVGAVAVAEQAAALEDDPGDPIRRRELAATLDQTLDAIARLTRS